MEACGQIRGSSGCSRLGFGCVGGCGGGTGLVVRKQKNGSAERAPTALLLEKIGFEIWVPSLEVRDGRPLLVHRHKQVQARTRTKTSCRPWR